MLGSNEAYQRISGYSHYLLQPFPRPLFVLTSFDPSHFIPLQDLRLHAFNIIHSICMLLMMYQAMQWNGMQIKGNMTLQEMTIRNVPNDSSQPFPLCYDPAAMGCAYLIWVILLWANQVYPVDLRRINLDLPFGKRWWLTCFHLLPSLWQWGQWPLIELCGPHCRWVTN